jgi:hypothetical protein
MMSQNEIHPLALKCKELAAFAKSEAMRAHRLDRERFWLKMANQDAASWNEVEPGEIIAL